MRREPPGRAKQKKAQEVKSTGHETSALVNLTTPYYNEHRQTHPTPSESHVCLMPWLALQYVLFSRLAFPTTRWSCAFFYIFALSGTTVCTVPDMTRGPLAGSLPALFLAAAALSSSYTSSPNPYCKEKERAVQRVSRNERGGAVSFRTFRCTVDVLYCPTFDELGPSKISTDVRSQA